MAFCLFTQPSLNDRKGQYIQPHFNEVKSPFSQGKRHTFFTCQIGQARGWPATMSAIMSAFMPTIMSSKLSVGPEMPSKWESESVSNRSTEYWSGWPILWSDWPILSHFQTPSLIYKLDLVKTGWVLFEISSKSNSRPARSALKTTQITNLQSKQKCVDSKVPIWYHSMISNPTRIHIQQFRQFRQWIIGQYSPSDLTVPRTTTTRTLPLLHRSPGVRQLFTWYVVFRG